MTSTIAKVVRKTYLCTQKFMLEDADIIRRCYNSNITGLPLEGNAIDNVFLPSGNIQRNTALSTSSSLEIITLGVMATC